MGALLSLPLAPISMLGTWISSCLGASICSCCLNSSVNPLMRTFKSSIATRIMYAFIFMINSIFSWIDQTDFNWPIFTVNKRCKIYCI